jgi:hypothetical protein
MLVKAEEGAVLIGFNTLATVKKNYYAALIVPTPVKVAIKILVPDLVQDTAVRPDPEPLTPQDRELAIGKATSIGNYI